MSKTYEYRLWQYLHQKCYNPKNKNYHNHGALGIKVCEQWDDFDVFYKDVGNRPSDKHTLTRIDDSKDFEPNNVRWTLIKKILNIGDRNGTLTIIEGPETRSKYQRNRIVSTDYYICKCDCGNVVERTIGTLTRNNNLHCGCNILGYKKNDIINGWKFIRYGSKINKKNRTIFAHCPFCDEETEVSLYDVTRKKNPKVSCGCKPHEFYVTQSLNGSVYHGHSKLGKDSIYQIWQSMKQRCYNPNTARYSSYGGRGIKICDRWLNSFLNFLEDMGPRPNPDYSIDRIDVNGDYEPDNCRWATVKIQNENRRPTKGIPKIKINIGDRFGKLIVISEAEPYILKSQNNKEFKRVNTICDCGNERICFTTKLNTGKVVSCVKCSTEK